MLNEYRHICEVLLQFLIIFGPATLLLFAHYTTASPVMAKRTSTKVIKWWLRFYVALVGINVFLWLIGSYILFFWN